MANTLNDLLQEGYTWGELPGGLKYQMPIKATPGWYPTTFYQKGTNPYPGWDQFPHDILSDKEDSWPMKGLYQQWEQNPEYVKIPIWQAANQYINDWENTYGLPFDQWFWLNNPTYSPNVQLPQNTVVKKPNKNINLGNITMPEAGGTTTQAPTTTTKTQAPTTTTTGTQGITGGTTTTGTQGIAGGNLSPVEQALVDYVNAQTGAANAQAKAMAGFDIPTDKFPTTTTYIGLPPEMMEQLQAYIDRTNPILDQYAGVLKNVASPASFISANRPVQKALVGDIINDLAQRGILSSTDAADLIREASMKVPQAYMQNLLGAAGALQTGAALPLAGYNVGRVSTSESINPLAPYELMLQALGMM